MAVDSTPVEIRINVVDGNSGEVVAQIQRNLSQIGAGQNSLASSVNRTTDAFRQQGQAAQMAVRWSNKTQQSMQQNFAPPPIRWSSQTKQLSQGFDESLDKVRLMRQELGIRVPRAMESIIARNKLLMSGISGLSNAIIAIGAAGIIVELGQEVYNLYEKYLSLNSAADAYKQSLQQAAEQDFGNTRSIEDTTARIDEATKAIQAYKSAAAKDTASAQHPSLWGAINPAVAVGTIIGGMHNAHSDLDNQYKQQQQLDKLQEPAAKQAHQQNLDQIEYNHALDGRLRGEQKITAELDKQREVNAENRRYDTQMSGLHGNKVSPTSGKDEMDVKNAIAERQADAETFNLSREQAQQLQRLRDEALQSGLRGNALYEAQEASAIDELKQRDMDSAAARDAIHQKFHNEEMKRLQDEQIEVAKRSRDAGGAGLTGIAKVQYEGQSRDQDILAKASTGGYASLADAQQDRVSNQQQTLAEMTAAEQSFTDRVNQLSDQSATHQISGFARIRSEAQKQIDGLRQEYEKVYGKNTSAPEYQQHLPELNRGIGIIQGGAQDQASDLARKNADETAQIEAEARSRSLSDEKQKTAAIESEYEDRLRKYQEDLNQQEISEDDFNRRVLAAQQERNAEMVEQAREAREKMASSLTGFFRDPLRALQNAGDKAAGQAGAALIQRAQGHFGGIQAVTGANDSGGIFDRMAGMPRPGNGHRGMIGIPGVSGSAASQTLSVSTAQIYVGSAVISGGGASGATSTYGHPAMASGSSWMTGSGLTSSSSSTAASFGTGVSGANYSSARPSFSGGAGIPMSSHGGASATIPGSVGGGVTGSGFAGALPGVTSGSGTSTAVVGDLRSGLSATNQIAGMFKKGSGVAGLSTTQDDIPNGTLNADGTYTNSGGGSLLQGGGFMSNASGLAGGALGMFGAFESKGGVGGALQGTMAGAQLGMALGGPIGGAIGAAAGAIVGAIGFGGRAQAENYYDKQVKPQMNDTVTSYDQGSMDYLTAYAALESLQTQAAKQTDNMGPGASGYYQDTIKPALESSEQKLTREQKAGRSAYGVSAAQYHFGGPINSFGSLADNADEGYIRAQRGEFMVSQQPAASHYQALSAINAGASHSQMAAYYGGSSRMPVVSGGDRTVNMHVYAHDSKSVAQFFRQNSHHVRSALNSSYGEYGGLADV